MEVKEEQEINMLEAKKILDERKKEGELCYEQKICSEFLDKISKISAKSPDELVAELSKINILKPRHIALIVNIMPDTEEEVKALFQKEIVNLKKDEIKQIVDIINKFKKS